MSVGSSVGCGHLLGHVFMSVCDRGVPCSFYSDSGFGCETGLDLWILHLST